MSLPRFSLNNRVVVIFAAVVAVAFGLVMYFTMPRRADPEITVRMCQVITQWPGVEAERVEQLVTRRLENEISQLEEIDLINSTTTTGLSVLKVEAESNIEPEMVSQVWDRVRSRIDSIRGQLPEGTLDPVVDDDFTTTSVMLIALFETKRLGNDDPGSYSPRDLEIIAERLRDRIMLLDGVATSEVHGELEEVVYLETSSSNWAKLGLTISDLENLLAGRNISASGGSIDSKTTRFHVQPSGEFDTVAQINNLIVSRDETGAPIRLSDLGIEVRRSYRDPPQTTARYGAEAGDAPCLIVNVIMKDGYKVTDLGPAVRSLLNEMQNLEKTIPPDITTKVVFDESSFVDSKISDFIENVIQAVIIVVVISLLFSGIRASLVMAGAIPFVMIISIGISARFGVDLEQMSIASLIIALGLLVDNAVVVCDNIRRLLDEGLSRKEAAIQGVEQIQFPTLVGTLTTVFAFLPLAFLLTGERAEYIFSIPTVVCTTLLTSWVLAVTLTTLMGYGLIHPSKKKEKPKAKAAEDSTGETPEKSSRKGSSGDFYTNLLHRVIGGKVWVIAGVFLLLFGVVRLPIGSEFFPDDARDYLYIDVWLPEGTSWTANDEVTREVESNLTDISTDPEHGLVGSLDSYYASIGGSGPRFSLGVNPQPPSPNFSQIIVRTTDASLTEPFIEKVRELSTQRIPGQNTFREGTLAAARVIPKKLGLGPPVDSPIGLRIYGRGYSDPGFSDEWEMRLQAEKVEAVFRDLDGVWDVANNWVTPGYGVKLEIDQEAASAAGVSNASVARSLNAYFAGHRLTSFREFDHEVPVYLRLPREERSSLPRPQSVFVEGTSGKVPLDSIAEMTTSRKFTRIERREKERMIEVQARTEPGILANNKFAEAAPALEEIERNLPLGYSFETAGMQEASEDAQGEIVAAFGVGLILMIFCLVVQYNSILKPFIVLTTVPMGAIGALFGLWVTGNPMGFMPMLGLVALAGMVLNSGILYLEFAEELIKDRLREGKDAPAEGERSCTGLTRQAFRDCLAEAGRIRLRPILLTASTTVGGLLPLAFFGGPMWAGISWLMIFGLTSATALTLLILPAIYALFVEHFRFEAVRVETDASAATQ
ncbi:MAG: efflux RND transporter permease subunit [Verrucomicrobiota bacterium]